MKNLISLIPLWIIFKEVAIWLRLFSYKTLYTNVVSERIISLFFSILNFFLSALDCIQDFQVNRHIHAKVKTMQWREKEGEGERREKSDFWLCDLLNNIDVLFCVCLDMTFCCEWIMFLRNTRPTRFGFRWNSLLKPFSQNAHFDQIFSFFVVILTSIIEITDHTHLHPNTHICTFNAWSSSKTSEKPLHTHLYFHMFYNFHKFIRVSVSPTHTLTNCILRAVALSFSSYLVNFCVGSVFARPT